jgi:hypothetical protein
MIGLLAGVDDGIELGLVVILDRVPLISGHMALEILR